MLSSSVSPAFQMLNNSDFDETSKFCRMFDKFFDCFNTRHMEEGRRNRKPDLDPYRSVNDGRFELSYDYKSYY